MKNPEPPRGSGLQEVGGIDRVIARESPVSAGDDRRNLSPDSPAPVAVSRNLCVRPGEDRYVAARRGAPTRDDIGQEIPPPLFLAYPLAPAVKFPKLADD